MQEERMLHYQKYMILLMMGNLDIKPFFINQFKSKQLAIPMNESFILNLENIIINSHK